MKVLSVVSVSLLLAVLIQSCNSAGKHHDEKENSEVSEWPEMDAFHMTMAEAYHPFKDSANLKPAKSLAGQLATEAETWAASKRPEKVNNETVTAKLQQLTTSCRTFSDRVGRGTPDSDLGKELTALHQQFHEIMESFHNEKH